MTDDRRPTRQRIAQQRRELPDAPGVYLFYDRKGELLYVGKARSIRKRVGSHFSGGEPRLTSRVDRFDFLVTANEAEALLAEQSFIKRHRPRFNIRLRDDKSYPYVAVSLDEDYPRVYFTREKHRSNRAYFGPFSSAKRVRETLDLLGKLFQFRTCEGPEPGRRSGSPCLDYYIKRCGAPCVEYVSREEYRRNIDAIVDFLSGRYRQVEADEQAKMDEAAGAQEFERAAIHRDRLAAIRSLFERQRIAGGSVGTADLIGVAAEGADANVQVFQVRDGILAERQSFYLDNEAERAEAEVAEEFIGQYYSASPSIPKTIVVGPYMGRERADLLGGGARRAPRGAGRGPRRRARRQAPSARARRAQRAPRARPGPAAARAPAGAAGRVARRPARRARHGGAAGADRGVRHLQPRRRAHRRLDGRLRGRRDEEGRLPPLQGPRRPARGGAGNGGPDDFASMEEVLGRRMNRYLEQADLSPHDGKRDESFAALPGLVVIDGGKGQLGGRVRALRPFTERGVTVIGLAKRLEEVFLPGRPGPIDLPADSEASKLLQRVRDEAHRFAIDHHRGRRDRAMTGSVLDGLRGVGPVRKRALLQHFGSPERFLAASREELEAVPGVPGKLAREIHEQLNRTN